jgi:putative SOS response-associated peptidase YedK
MCGRYELHSNPAAIALAFGLPHTPEVAPHYNIAPTNEVPLVRVGNDGERELVHMRWGLVPRWAKDPSIGARMINARGETLAEKQSFRTAYRRHRCLLPANGFYEWRAPAHGGGDHHRRLPQHIGMADGSLFGIAGIFERWLSEEGEVLDTCAIVTTGANELLAPLHDRMPVIIAADDYARWLDPTNAEVADLITPYPPEAMAYHPVSTRVNSVRHDDASLIEPAAPSDLDAAEAEPPPHTPEQESLFDEEPPQKTPEQESLF